MIRSGLDRVQPGQLLGKTLYNERGDVLLRRGAALTDRYLALLREKGFSSVHVVAPEAADVEAEDIVSERVHATATKNIYRYLEVIANAASDVQPEKLGAAFHSADFKKAATGKAYEALYAVAEAIIDEVIDASILSGLNAIKTHDNYTFCHSVDVTVTAVMIGKKFFLDKDALRQLALGCLLHDTGKLFISPAILNKPDRLTPQELEEVKKHPTLGYQMLRSIQRDQYLANHVAYQHHERQDGSGYPRGLRGANRIAREARSPGHILLIAEIAAVADVYDALGSDRPYRAGMTPDQIVQTMRTMTGPHLNREVMAHFLSILPVFPVGMDVRVSQGRFAGHRGVVVRVNQKALDRPTVRLLWDGAGRRIAPLEVDFNREEGAALAATFAPGALSRAS